MRIYMEIAIKIRFLTKISAINLIRFEGEEVHSFLYETIDKTNASFFLIL